MKNLIIATQNKGKIKEFSELLKYKYNVISMREAGFLCDIEETGNTFYENALIKAKTVSEYINEDCLADDSGLMVDSLNGEPGILSARYFGENATDDKNINKLLTNLSGITNRNAKFVSFIVLYKTNGEIITGYGETNGEILLNKCGSNGFGYDSVFYSLDLKKSFGLATDTEKNSVSHRSRAINDLLKKL